MSYPRENTIQGCATSAAGGAAEVKLNAGTGSTTGTGIAVLGHAISANQRWRLKTVVASYSATPAAGSTLTITDGVFTLVFDLNNGTPLVVPLGDGIQCAAGAEVDVTLSAGASTVVAHVNVVAVCEG